ncbi:MAG: hypothetical protein HRU29_16130 [Rhizobiales bacterium]|nr:DUF5680 domain-containing protein [Hyphomicrobiales bacterium]NRB15922.1 hypothetical protein [Hyphomicrobiales bacterium]
MNGLEAFIVAAKAACYVGEGNHVGPCRLGAHDLRFDDGDWRYLDSYFGGTNFIGQEVVWHNNAPVWAMNYYGYILRPDLINAEKAGNVIKLSLGLLYEQNRFLGGFEHFVGEYLYHDNNEGQVTSFRGVETISRQGIEAYKLEYHGGVIKD